MHPKCFIQVYVPWHLTPASSKWPCWQVTMELCEHSVRLLSFPLQPMSSRWIWPTPAPKWAPPKANAPAVSIGSNYYKAQIKCAAKLCMLMCLWLCHLCSIYCIWRIVRTDGYPVIVTQWSECWKLKLGVQVGSSGFNSCHCWLFSFLNFTSNYWTFIMYKWQKMLLAYTNFYKFTSIHIQF